MTSTTDARIFHCIVTPAQIEYVNANAVTQLGDALLSAEGASQHDAKTLLLPSSSEAVQNLAAFFRLPAMVAKLKEPNQSYTYELVGLQFMAEAIKFVLRDARRPDVAPEPTYRLGY